MFKSFLKWINSDLRPPIMKLLFAIYIFITSIGIAQCLFIDGCPLFGCRPSGSFSFSQTVPRTDVSVNWVSKFLLDPVPLAGGCSSDAVNIVCLSNGPFSDNKGYISIYSQNGTIRWRDRILTYPTMPMLDNYGDVTGTDGISLVHYDQDGKKYPIINMRGTAPLFNIQLVGTFYLLMVSENGGLFVRDTNAIPVASIFLNDSVQRTNGTFIPIAQPVVNGQRFYLLTEFVPTSQVRDPKVLNLQRLYAIDIHNRPADIMTVAWFYNFEMEYNEKQNEFLQEVNFFKRNVFSFLEDDIRIKQNLLWDESRQTVYVALPHPYKYGVKRSQQPNTFWALKDDGNDTSIIFRSDIDVTHMVTYERDVCSDASPSPQLWATTSSSKIISVSKQGKATKEIDLNALLNAEVVVTSKLALVKENDTVSDILVLGLTTSSQIQKPGDDSLRFVPKSKAATPYVVAIDTGPENGSVLWKVPVPEGLEVKGQISGSMAQDESQKDQLVLYADDGAKAAKIFTLH